MKIAVIKTGGKQYKIKEGDFLKIEKLNPPKGEVIKFDTLLIADGNNVRIGQPVLGKLVEAKILETGKSKKISIIKFKNKIRYKKNVGHRQLFTKVQITSIN